MNDDMLSPQSRSIEPPRRDRITAISTAVQRRPIVLVVGMHRSGTSLCSHILSALGVDMADKIAGPGNASVTADNPRGHWERWEIVAFHDRILGLFNRDYWGRFHDFALPVAWWADPRVAQIRREIVAFLEKRMGDGYFGLKDPRMVRLMPVWHQIFNELKLAPKVVLCLRNPAQVARSLHARDGVDPKIGEYRWLIHLVDFFRYAHSFDFCTVEYEEWFSDPSANFEKLQRFVDLQWQQSESDLALVLSGIIDPAARHDGAYRLEASQPLVRTFYKLTGSAGQDPAARDQIANIVSQFVGFQQLQGPLLQVLEGVAKTADATVAAADARAVAVEDRLADALEQIEQQRTQIADLARERHEASGLKATLADRETAITELSHRAEELGVALQAAQVQLATHEAALQRADQEAQERGAAALAMESEITTSRIALVQSEREAQSREVAAERLQGEVAGLRETLARVEREVQRRATAAAALQGEIVTLRDSLTAARQVGKAVIEAFRIEGAATPKPDRPRGWRHAIARFWGAEASF
jgi:hypothetical protein